LVLLLEEWRARLELVSLGRCLGWVSQAAGPVVFLPSFLFLPPAPAAVSLLCRRQIHVYLAGFVGVHTLHQVKAAISLSVRTHPRNSLSLHLRNRT
jgi:hypothetical protein